MTDARLPERWLNDRRLQRLSAEHYRTYVNCLLWAVSNRTDGHIEREDLALIPHWSANAAQAFVDAHLFTPTADGWLIADYASTQTARDELEVLDNMRARDREKKAAARARKVAGTPDFPRDGPGDVPGDGPGELSRGAVPGTRQARTGQARTGLGQAETAQTDSVSTNGAPLSPRQQQRIDANVRAGYDS